MRIIIANAPRSYREVIAVAVQTLRPYIEVILVAPEDLDREVKRLEPHLVVCSELTTTVQERSLAWILLYPEGKTQVVISMARQTTTVNDLEFERLLAIVDDAEHLAVHPDVSLQ